MNHIQISTSSKEKPFFYKEISQIAVKNMKEKFLSISKEEKQKIEEKRKQTYFEKI